MLIVLRGAQGSGKSYVARSCFRPEQIVSSDNLRGLISGDPSYQKSSAMAFKLLRYIIDARLAHGQLTVLDATNLRIKDVKGYIETAKHNCVPFKIISIKAPKKILQERIKSRFTDGTGVNISEEVLDTYLNRYDTTTHLFEKQFGSDFVEFQSDKYLLSNVESFIAISVDTRYQSFYDTKGDSVWAIGDIHGCPNELSELIEKIEESAKGKDLYLYSVGDLIDRGPDFKKVLEICIEKNIRLIHGNHESCFIQEYFGKSQCRSSSRRITLDDFEKFSKKDKTKILSYIFNSNYFEYVRDIITGQIVFLSHAGIAESEIDGFIGSRFGSRYKLPNRKACLHGPEKTLDKKNK